MSKSNYTPITLKTPDYVRGAVDFAVVLKAEGIDEETISKAINRNGIHYNTKDKDNQSNQLTIFKTALSKVFSENGPSKKEGA